LNSHGNTFLLNPVYQGEKPQRSTKFEYWFHANSCLHRKASFNKHEKDNVSGKLDTYFSYKSMFQKEKYLEINNFEVRQILCRFRISSHHLRVETERHKKNS
jgi:hypothetical protein